MSNQNLDPSQTPTGPNNALLRPGDTVRFNKILVQREGSSPEIKVFHGDGQVVGYTHDRECYQVRSAGALVLVPYNAITESQTRVVD